MVTKPKLFSATERRGRRIYLLGTDEELFLTLWLTHRSESSFNLHGFEDKKICHIGREATGTIKPTKTRRRWVIYSFVVCLILHLVFWIIVTYFHISSYVVVTSMVSGLKPPLNTSLMLVTDKAGKEQIMF